MVWVRWGGLRHATGDRQRLGCLISEPAGKPRPGAAQSGYGGLPSHPACRSACAAYDRVCPGLHIACRRGSGAASGRSWFVRKKSRSVPKVAMGSLPQDAGGVEPVESLCRFRQAFSAGLGARADDAGRSLSRPAHRNPAGPAPNAPAEPVGQRPSERVVGGYSARVIRCRPRGSRSSGLVPNRCPHSGPDDLVVVWVVLSG